MLLLMLSPNIRSLENKLDTLLKCQHKLTQDNINFEIYYDSADTVPNSVHMIRFKENDVFKCALFLDGCVTGCGCASGSEPLLINSDATLNTADAWNIECKEMETYTKVEQRSTSGSNENSKPKALTADGVVSGDKVPQDATGLLKDIRDANKGPEPKTITVTTPAVQSNDTIVDNGLSEIKAAISELNDLTNADFNIGSKSLDSDDPDTVLTTSTEAVEEKSTTTKAATTSTSTTTSITTTTTTTTSTTTAAPVTSAKVEETTAKKSETKQVDELEKDEQVLEKDGTVLQDNVDELGALQTKYYVVVAFVVVFVLLLVLIAVVLFVKMKKTRGGHAIISPGPTDQEPLTPSGTNGAFKFDGNRT